jgi:hypothetical protein
MRNVELRIRAVTLTPRTARLILISGSGAYIGALPPIAVDTPWWQDIAPVVRAARERYGIEVVVLRLLHGERPQPPGGEVTYLAQVDVPVESSALTREPWGELDEQPLRHAYARPGGPAADLAWAQSVLERHGMRMTAPPEQIRTWNLSSVWRLPVGKAYAWLKVVPPFMVREGRLLVELGHAPVATVLGHDGGRCLLAEVPGTDLYDATPDQLIEMVSLLVRLQSRYVRRLEPLLELGLPDWRGAALIQDVADTLRRTSHELANDDVQALSAFVADLPRRFEAIRACGIPDTLVHGDFHPGNFRGDETALTLLDWGDSGVGHPLLDQSAFLERVQPPHLDAVRDHWARCWRAVCPSADPAAAARLLAPLAAARRAAIYRRFLDHIEPAEHPYHRTDPADWLQQTAALLRDGASR